MQQCKHGMLMIDIQVCSRLIKQDDRSGLCERARNHHTMPLSTGERGHGSIAEVIKFEHMQSFIHKSPVLYGFEARSGSIGVSAKHDGSLHREGKDCALLLRDMRDTAGCLHA